MLTRTSGGIPPPPPFEDPPALLDTDDESVTGMPGLAERANTVNPGDHVLIADDKCRIATMNVEMPAQSYVSAQDWLRPANNTAPTLTMEPRLVTWQAFTYATLVARATTVTSRV